MGDLDTEDSNDDGLVDVLDCAGSGSAAGLTKADVYVVEMMSSSPSRAFCADTNDVVLGGGCNTFTAITEYSRPLNADDPTQPAGWECFASGGPTSVAYAICLTVN